MLLETEDTPGLTDKMLATLLAAFELHPNIESAAQATGTPLFVLQAWMKRARLGGPDLDPRLRDLLIGFTLITGRHKQQAYESLKLNALKSPHASVEWLRVLHDKRGSGWNDTDPSNEDKEEAQIRLWRNPGPKLRQQLAAAGMQIVPIDPETGPTPNRPYSTERTNDVVRAYLASQAPPPPRP